MTRRITPRSSCSASRGRRSGERSAPLPAMPCAGGAELVKCSDGTTSRGLVGALSGAEEACAALRREGAIATSHHAHEEDAVGNRTAMDVRRWRRGYSALCCRPSACGRQLGPCPGTPEPAVEVFVEVGTTRMTLRGAVTAEALAAIVPAAEDARREGGRGPWARRPGRAHEGKRRISRWNARLVNFA